MTSVNLAVCDVEVFFFGPFQDIKITQLNDFIRVLIYPFRSTALVVNLVFTIAFSLLIFGLDSGIIGAMMTLPGWIILLPWFIKYCFIVGRHSANGIKTSPNLNYDDLSPLELLPIVFTVTLVLIAVTAYSLFGPTSAVVIVVLLSPAIISAFIVEGSLLSAINPLSWLTYITGLGLSYLLMLAILLAASALLYLIPEGIGIILTVFLIQSIFIGMFQAVGMLLYAKNESIGFTIPASREEQLDQIDQHFSDVHFAETVSKWHRLAEVKRYDTALQAILKYIAEKEDNLDIYAQIFSALLNWRDLKLAAMFMPHYNEKLFRMKHPGQAFSNLLHIWDGFGPVMPLTDATSLRLSQIAIERGRQDISIAILKHFAIAFPASPMLGTAQKSLHEIEMKG